MKRKKNPKKKAIQVGRWVVISILAAIILAASVGAAVVAYHAAYSLKVRGGPHGVHVVARGDTIEGSARGLGIVCGFVAFCLVLAGGGTLALRIVSPEFLQNDKRQKTPHPAERYSD